ncbi:MAG: hypothetical protein VB122_00840 [Erysipelotrichales bacterium]|nr:hypothetical protein [Erysipelotrichales bacterium]
MGIYEQLLIPILEKVSVYIENTHHMKDILNGTMSKERFVFQIRQNYQYLLDYTRCWTIGFSKCQNYADMEKWYMILKSTMEQTVMINRTYWSKQINVDVNELDKVIEAPGKKSYTSFQLMCAGQGDLASTMMALFPCNILYRYFVEHLLDKCTLDKNNQYYIWLKFYLSDSYVKKTNDEINMINDLCADKNQTEINELLNIFATSCNYEILQWEYMYHSMTTWPLDEIFVER